MEVKVVRKKTLLTMLGLVFLGLVSGFVFYGPLKEKDMDSKESMTNAAEKVAVNGRLGASPQERTETATFAMG
jgi:hypothetical protein